MHHKYAITTLVIMAVLCAILAPAAFAEMDCAAFVAELIVKTGDDDPCLKLYLSEDDAYGCFAAAGIDHGMPPTLEGVRERIRNWDDARFESYNKKLESYVRRYVWFNGESLIGNNALIFDVADDGIDPWGEAKLRDFLTVLFNRKCAF